MLGAAGDADTHQRRRWQTRREAGAQSQGFRSSATAGHGSRRLSTVSSWSAASARGCRAPSSRLGDAFAAKLDLPVLSGIVLHGSVEALDADGGQFAFDVGDRSSLVETAGDDALGPLLQTAARAAQRDGSPQQVQLEGVWALAVPLAAGGEGGSGRGTLTVARRGREFRTDEQELLVAWSTAPTRRSPRSSRTRSFASRR